MYLLSGSCTDSRYASICCFPNIQSGEMSASGTMRPSGWSLLRSLLGEERTWVRAPKVTLLPANIPHQASSDKWELDDAHNFAVIDGILTLQVIR